MVEAARAGGTLALEYYRRELEVSLKPDRSPVTEADRAAEAAILDVLRARCRDHGALGEELGESGPRARRFIVDPIDGSIPRGGGRAPTATARGSACPRWTRSSARWSCTPR